MWPLFAIMVGGVAGAEVLVAVDLEIGSHHHRAAASRAPKAPCSFNRQYRPPEMLARLPLECRAVAIDEEFIPVDFEADLVCSPPPHSGVDFPVGAVRDLYP